MEVSGQLHATAALPPGEIAHCTHWIGGWVRATRMMDYLHYTTAALLSGRSHHYSTAGPRAGLGSYNLPFSEL
jgi:hypothetical protein